MFVRSCNTGYWNVCRSDMKMWVSSLWKNNWSENTVCWWPDCNWPSNVAHISGNVHFWTKCNSIFQADSVNKHIHLCWIIGRECISICPMVFVLLGWCMGVRHWVKQCRVIACCSCSLTAGSVHGFQSSVRRLSIDIFNALCATHFVPCWWHTTLLSKSVSDR